MFNNVWDAQGEVREDVLGEPDLVTMCASGIERVEFTGGLTEGMRAEPDRINWGLAEIARVDLEQQRDSLIIRLEWEGKRRPEIECSSADISRA